MKYTTGLGNTVSQVCKNVSKLDMSPRTVRLGQNELVESVKVGQQPNLRTGFNHTDLNLSRAWMSHPASCRHQRMRA